jgi:carboxypeptidase T
VTSIVDTREVWIVFMVNPDGGQYTLTGDPYRPWRKNRQPNPGSSAIGTDLNRNYAYRWGCCGGSSGRPASADYRGPEPWSAPEARAIRDLVLGRIVGGRQQIRVAITFHIPGRLVLWPYGYTSADVPPDMTRLDRETYVAMGRAMAARNGYRPLQWGDGRRVDGVAIDWLYGTQRIFAYLVELGDSARIPDEEIGPETSRNRDAVLYLMEQARCPYRAIGGAARFCGPFFDDLEIARGWKVDPDGTDTAAGGGWARGIPTAGSRQLGTAVSGRAVLATGLAGGRDLDGGRTTVRSPIVHLPARASSLHLRYWVGMGADATTRDRVRVRLVGRDGAALATALTVRGSGRGRAPRWRTLDYRIPVRLAGRDVAIELVATDAGRDSTVEAGVDEVRVTAP